MPKFRKKPVVVEAIFWRGHEDDAELREFAGHWVSIGEKVYVTTLEGAVVLNPGEWLIKGTAGEFYPCKPQIFDGIYEPDLGDDDENSQGSV
jgi:hypothetical protein